MNGSEGDAQTAVDVLMEDRSLLGYATLLTGNRDDGEDLLQEAKTRYLAAQQQGASIETPNAYLRRIIVTTFLNGYRGDTRRQRLNPLFKITTSAPSIDESIAVREELRQALRRLPERQRAAIVLRYYLDLEFHDIANIVGCSESTARSHVRRGLRKLRLSIEEDS